MGEEGILIELGLLIHHFQTHFNCSFQKIHIYNGKVIIKIFSFHIINLDGKNHQINDQDCSSISLKWVLIKY